MSWIVTELILPTTIKNKLITFCWDVRDLFEPQLLIR